MAIELIVIVGGIIFGFIGFLIGALLVMRAYRQSPSLNHYKAIVDILTLRKLRKKSSSFGGTYESDIKKGSHIKHYEDMRDKLTTRKKEEVIVVDSGGGRGGLLGPLIGGFITILIGVTLLPEIVKQVGNAQQVSNMTSPSTEMASTLLGIVPLFFGLAVAGAAIAIVFGALRSSGMV